MFMIQYETNIKLKIYKIYKHKQTQGQIVTSYQIIITKNNIILRNIEEKVKKIIEKRGLQRNLILNPTHNITQQHFTNQVIMLIFDKDTIEFTYIEKSHLKSSLTITNDNDQFVYYKFKITQPKYYLIKQDKGIIKPKETVVIDITLHKDKGVPTAAYDKIKCFYTLTDNQLTHEPQNFQRRSDTRTHKFIIKVNNLPQGLEKMPSEMKQSQVTYFFTAKKVKSVQRSQSSFGKTSKNFDSLSLQKQIEQKEEQIVKIKNEMSTIRTTMQKTEVTQKPQPSAALAIWAVMGLVIGTVIGVWWW